MELKAYAKLNLFLDIVGRREDGYHLLKMIMQSVDLYDTVKIVPSEKLEVSCGEIDEKNNSAYKAAKLFKNRLKRTGENNYRKTYSR